MSSRSYGFKIEEKVRDHLIKEGFSLITHNFTTLLGEIDCLVQKNQILIAVEVRARSSKDITGLDTVSSQKQRRIEKVLDQFLFQYFLENKKSEWKEIRFDVVSVEIPSGKLTHIQNAWNPH